MKENELIVNSENLMELLEDIYYSMGKKYYDISTKKQREKADKFYFIKKPFSAIAFSKMKTLGLAALITNDPTATSGRNGKKIKFDKLIKEDKEFAEKIAIDLNKKDKKIKFYTVNDNNEVFENQIEDGKRKENKGGESEIFIDEGYTKTPLMEFDYSFLENGNKSCSLTGERFKKLLSATLTSPLLAKITNFDSFNKFNSRDISWKASYLSKFSPVVCFYNYNGLEKIVCYFIFSSNLVKSLELYNEYKELFLDEKELLENNYMSNFKPLAFNIEKKEKTSKGSDLIHESEILFGLLYSIYRKHFFNNSVENEVVEKAEFDEFNLSKNIEKIPIILTYFRSDKFASTMRPVLFDEFNHYKYIMSFFIHLEKNGYNSFKIGQFLKSMVYLKSSYQNSKDRYQLERVMRDKILSKILNIKSIVPDIEEFFYRSFGDLLSGENYRYRNYNLVFEILKLYEKFIEFGGNNFMNDDLQGKAIKLGKSIGISILKYEILDTDNEKIENEKKGKNLRVGRKYVISLKKSRTLEKFTSEIARIELKYNLVINNDLLQSLNNRNWELIKNYCVISILNIFNMELLPEKSKEGDK